MSDIYNFTINQLQSVMTDFTTAIIAVIFCLIIVFAVSVLREFFEGRQSDDDGVFNDRDEDGVI